MFISVLSVLALGAVSAAGEVSSGEVISVRAEEYQSFEYEVLDDGTVSITRFKGDETVVTIPEYIEGRKVTRLGDDAFFMRLNIVSVTLPESIEYIGDHAFSNCLALESIDLPEGLTYIGSRAFMGCNRIKTVRIPSSLSTIKPYTFMQCIGLKSVIMPEGVETIEDRAFIGCSNLKSVMIPRSVTSIDRQAFGYGIDGDTDETSIYNDFIVYGYNGTAAQDFARKKFTFIPLDDRKAGDVNGDGVINMSDLTRLQQYLAEWEADINELNADLDGIEGISMSDLTRLQQFLAEWEVEIL